MVFHLGGNISGSRPPEKKVVTIRVIGNHSGDYLFQQKITKTDHFFKNSIVVPMQMIPRGFYSHVFSEQLYFYAKIFLFCEKNRFLILGGNLTGSRPSEEKVVTIRVVTIWVLYKTMTMVKQVLN